jgi:quinol monooxygenase YgiN
MYRNIDVIKTGMMIPSRRPANRTGAGFPQESIMATTDNANQNLIVTAFWEVNSGEEGAVAALLKDFLPQAQREPGVKEFQIHQNVAKPREFFFYEVFAGEAAFAEHQQTDHFKNIILGQAIPRLAKRERSQFRFI